MTPKSLPPRPEGVLDLVRVATAGSVDDGKSTLIGRLLFECQALGDDRVAAARRSSKVVTGESLDFSLLADGLQCEREQGITIDVAYLHLRTPRRHFIIADTPGHEQYTRNMVTGGSTADVAVILLDAQRGMTVQSKRHAFIASLLRIPHVIVAVNKMDLVDYDEGRFSELRRDFEEFSTRLEIADLSYVPLSALRGDNVASSSQRMPWYQGGSLLYRLEQLSVVSDRNLVDFRFPVQCTLRDGKGYRGHAGTVASGIVRLGDDVLVLPKGIHTTVSSIHRLDEIVSEANAGEAVALVLADAVDVSRGDFIVHPKNLPAVRREVEALLVWMSEAPLVKEQPYVIQSAARSVRGVVSDLLFKIDPETLRRRSAEQLELNEIARAVITPFTPWICDDYERNRTTGSFVLIDATSHATVAAGMIITRGHGHPVSVALGEERPQSLNIERTRGSVTRNDRTGLLRQRPATLWLTGLSGSGKSTLAFETERRLIRAGHAAYTLDGDNVRHGLSSDLAFSAQDRRENIRRVAEVCALFNDAGLLVLCAFISPFLEDRARARRIVGTDRFFEVFMDVPLEVCEDRDPKGLYKKARAGNLPGMTGITSPYEPPPEPDLRVPSHRLSVDESADLLVQHLKEHGFLEAD